jgi:hypothetical protein
MTGRYQAEIAPTACGFVQLAVALLEPVDLDVLAGERLHHPHPGDALLQVGQRGADVVAHLEVGVVRVALELDAGHDHRGQRHGAHQHQLPRHRGQHGQRRHQQQAVGHEHRQAHLDELGQRVDVGGHA